MATLPLPSKLRGSEAPEELSFPPDADSCGLLIGMSRWWCMSSAQQGSVVSTLVASDLMLTLSNLDSFQCSAN